MAPAGKHSSWRSLAPLAQLGTTLFACVAIGLALGYGADLLLDTRPWLLLVGLGLGIAAAGVNLYRAIRDLSRVNETDGSR
jgi:F0F1-type ATP synthase assembly protein I